MPGGRPTIFTEKLAKKICDNRAKGISLRKMCEAKNMPHRATVRLWLIDNKEFFNQYAQAIETDSDNEFEDMIALADECTDPAMAQIYKLRIDTRKWVLSKRQPKKYSDKINQEHIIAGDPDKPLKWEVEIIRPKETD